MKENKEKYSLWTAISMIVGICIGSGIFFKADDVLRDTGGSVSLGIIIFVMGAFGIIFGSLSLSEFSIISKTNGGIVGYFEEFVSPRIGSAFAWFQTFLYLPTINVVVSWVAGIYTLQILNISFTLEKATSIGTGYLLLFYGINYVSMKLGGDFQRFSAFIKLIPLFLIAILGFIYGDQLDNDIQNNFSQRITTQNHSFAWLAALTPMAFSYDGWTVILNISKDIKNGRRNVPLALFIGPLVVLIAYLAYFIGLIKILGVNQILTMGDDSIYQVGNRFFGEYGGSVITLFILVSILGVTNGLTIGSIRMPELLASKGMIKLKSNKNNLSTRPTSNSMIVSLSCSLFWMTVHYTTQKFNIFNGGDISELAVTFSYICYLILYVKIIQLRKKGILKKSFKNGLAPILGMFSSLMILIGAVVTNPSTIAIFMCLCLLVCGCGYISYKKMNGIKIDA